MCTIKNIDFLTQKGLVLSTYRDILCALTFFQQVQLSISYWQYKTINTIVMTLENYSLQLRTQSNCNFQSEAGNPSVLIFLTSEYIQTNYFKLFNVFLNTCIKVYDHVCVTVKDVCASYGWKKVIIAYKYINKYLKCTYISTVCKMYVHLYCTYILTDEKR